MIYRVIHWLGLQASRKALTEAYSRDFYHQFRQRSSQHLAQILPVTPDIGKSVFRLNYQFTPAYIAWYKTLKELGLPQEQAIRWIWQLNENLFQLIPAWLMKRYGAKIYLGGFRQKAAAHEQRCLAGSIHPYDYEIRFRDLDENTFEIDIFSCGMMKLAAQFGAEGLFPGLCRIDYLISHYMGCGFYRTKTLGDGDSLCNCGYQLQGECAWNPEEGFENQR